MSDAAVRDLLAILVVGLVGEFLLTIPAGDALALRVGLLDFRAILGVGQGLALAVALFDVPARVALQTPPRRAAHLRGLAWHAVVDRRDADTFWTHLLVPVALDVHLAPVFDQAVAVVAAVADVVDLLGAVRDGFGRTHVAVGLHVVVLEDGDHLGAGGVGIWHVPAVDLLVAGALPAVDAVGVALLPEQVFEQVLLFLILVFPAVLDQVVVREFAGVAAGHGVAGVADFAVAEFGLLGAVVGIVRVLGVLALGFLVERHVVLKPVRVRVHLHVVDLSLGIVVPTLLVLARVTPVAPPGVLHDPISGAGLVMPPADHFHCVPACFVGGHLVRRRFLDVSGDTLVVLLDCEPDGESQTLF